MDRTLLFLSLVAGTLLAVSAVPQFGPCPVVTVKDDFNATQYVGTWYELKRYFAIFEMGVNCSKANYTLLPNNKLRVNNTATVYDRKTKQRKAVNTTGVAYAPNPYIPAKLLVKFDNSPNGTKPADYWVVDTDYDTFAIVWSCQTFAGGLGHNAYSWILGRNQTAMSNDVEAKVDKALSKAGIDSSLFKEAVQTDCLN